MEDGTAGAQEIKNRVTVRPGTSTLSICTKESKQGLEEIAAHPRHGSTVPSIHQWMDGARKRTWDALQP